MPPRLLALALLLPLAVHAKDPKVITANWDQLAKATEGRVVTIQLKPDKRLNGRLTNLDDKSITVDQGKKRGAITISRSEIQSVSASRLKPGSTGRIVGTAVGAGIGIAILGAAVRYSINEGGNTVPTVGAAIAGLATLAGYGIGSGFDHAAIRIEIPDLHK